MNLRDPCLILQKASGPAYRRRRSNHRQSFWSTVSQDFGNWLVIFLPSVRSGPSLWICSRSCILNRWWTSSIVSLQVPRDRKYCCIYGSISFTKKLQSILARLLMIEVKARIDMETKHTIPFMPLILMIISCFRFWPYISLLMATFKRLGPRIESTSREMYGCFHDFIRAEFIVLQCISRLGR
jgi:hypothetical protein